MDQTSRPPAVSVAPGTAGGLTRQLLLFEIALVLCLSLGRSAVYSIVSLVASVTAPGGLAAQHAVMNGSLAPDRPWLDLTRQLLGIGFGLVPVALAAYLLVRSGSRLPLGLVRGRTCRRTA